jgi:hypothetical protein
VKQSLSCVDDRMRIEELTDDAANEGYVLLRKCTDVVEERKDPRLGRLDLLDRFNIFPQILNTVDFRVKARLAGQDADCSHRRQHGLVRGSGVNLTSVSFNALDSKYAPFTQKSSWDKQPHDWSISAKMSRVQGGDLCRVDLNENRGVPDVWLVAFYEIVCGRQLVACALEPLHSRLCHARRI